MISIITVNYNDGLGLETTINSVRDQTFRDYEHIVIDGGSTDNSKEVLSLYQEDLTYAVSEPDSGVYNAMNKGIRASNGKYLMFLNSGDALANDNALMQVSEFFEEDIDIFYGDLILVSGLEEKKRTYPDVLSFHYFFHRGHIPHPAMFTKRSLFDDIYYYKEDFKIVSDWDFYVCAICKYNVSYKHIDVVVTRFDTEGISSRPEHRQTLLDEKEASLRANFPLFYEDHEELQKSNILMESSKFRMLRRLEEHTFANKVITFWLKLLSRLFT